MFLWVLSKEMEKYQTEKNYRERERAREERTWYSDRRSIPNDLAQDYKSLTNQYRM